MCIRDSPDGGLGAAEPMDVEGQKDEAVEAAEEEEGGQHGPRERATDHGDERGDHARSGGFRAGARMPADPMRRGEYIIATPEGSMETIGPRAKASPASARNDPVVRAARSRQGQDSPGARQR